MHAGSLRAFRRPPAEESAACLPTGHSEVALPPTQVRCSPGSCAAAGERVRVRVRVPPARAICSRQGKAVDCAQSHGSQEHQLA